MTTLFDVPLGSAEPVDQKVPQPLFGVCEVPRRIHRPEHIVLRHPTVEGRHHTRNAGLADRLEHVLLPHELGSILRERL